MNHLNDEDEKIIKFDDIEKELTSNKKKIYLKYIILSISFILIISLIIFIIIFILNRKKYNEEKQKQNEC